MKTRIVTALIAAMIGAAPSARADTVRLRSGQEVEGRLTAASYSISTPDEGVLVVPIASTRSLRFGEGETVTVELVEGQELQGRFDESEIELDRGLFSSKFSPADVSEILVDPRAETITLPAGTRLRLMLAEWLNSRTTEPGQVVRFCMAKDVEVNGKTALPRG